MAARALVHLPPSIRRGDVIEVRALIAHPMETGYRPGADGRVLPRDIIRSFRCRLDEADVFRAELHPAISANPYLAFHVRADRAGTLECEWRGDNGFSHVERVALQVA